MEDEIQAASAEIAPVESAPTESEAPEVEQVDTSEEVEVKEKMVPLSALQKEREQRKSAQELLRQYQNPQEEYEEVDQGQILTRDQYEFLQREGKAWDKAEREFSKELEEKPLIKDLAEGYRHQMAIKAGKYVDPYTAVKAIIDGLAVERAEGQKAAQKSTEVQKMAAIQGAGTKVDSEASEVSTLKSQLASRNKKESEAALIELAKRGVL
jgi:hypothetical protein